MRRGALSFSVQTLVVLILILMLLGGATEFAQALANALSRGYADIDDLRMQKGMESLIGEGAATLRLKLHNKYKFGVLKGGFTADADFLKRKMKLKLPKGKYLTKLAVSPLKTDKICIIKQGYKIALSNMARCSPQYADWGAGSCPADPADTCQPFIPNDGTPAIQNKIHPRNVPSSGYYCKNGVAKRQNFFKKYYRSCYEEATGSHRDLPDTFMRLNRIACPNRVFLHKIFGCRVSASFRCDSGAQMTVEVKDPGLDNNKSRSFKCTGDIQHKTVGFRLNLTSATIPYDLNFTMTNGTIYRSRQDQDLRVVP